MKRNRQFEIALSLVLAFIVCACGASARQKTIRITYESVNVAADALPLFVEMHSKAIVDEAKARGATKEEARAELDAFIARAQHAHLVVIAAYRMITAAAVLNDDRSLVAMLKVAALLKDELKDLGVKLP